MSNISADNKKLLEGIMRDLGEGPVSEAYVAMPKQYDLRTEFLSARSKEAHKRLYEEGADFLTRISAELDAVDTRNEARKYHLLKREEIANLNSVYLHELYFANISDINSEVTIDSLAHMRISRDFGSFDRWQYDMVACAQGHGSGWAVTCYSTFLRRYVNVFIEGDDVGALMGSYPVIALDVHEHAYYRDYLDDKKAYVYAMMKELNWKIIEERFKRAEMIGEALK